MTKIIGKMRFRHIRRGRKSDPDVAERERSLGKPCKAFSTNMRSSYDSLANSLIWHFPDSSAEFRFSWKQNICRKYFADTKSALRPCFVSILCCLGPLYIHAYVQKCSLRKCPNVKMSKKTLCASFEHVEYIRGLGGSLGCLSQCIMCCLGSTIALYPK